MDDGSHVVQFHSMAYETSKWTGWLGPIHTRQVYYSISPLDIIRLTPKHIYHNQPTSWMQLDANSDGVIDEGREKLWDGQEVFVRWKNNRHAVYFDGNVVLQEREEEEEEVGKDLNCEGNEICTDAGCIYTDDGVCVSKKGYNGGRGGGNYKVSVQYNDGDFERNVPLDLIFVKVF